MRAPTYRGSGWPGVPVDRRPGAAERIPAATQPERLGLRVRAVVWNLLWELGRRLPERAAFGLTDLAARLAFRLARRTRLQAARNLMRVVGRHPDPLAACTREAFRSYGRYWVEAFRAADMPPAEVDRRTTTEGFDHLDAVLEQGRGAIVLLAHHGSWDLAARWAESHGYHLAVVAEIVRPRRLFEKFVRLREDLGLEVVPLRRGEDLAGRLTEVLAANHLVGLLCDRDLSGVGPIVELFGEPCRLPHGPATLAKRSGAPVVPITMLQRPGRRWHLQVLPALELADVDTDEGMSQAARALEVLIRLDPTQWHAFSPMWLADQPTTGADEQPMSRPRDVGTS